MSITVKLKYLRISPRKVRMVADAIREKTANEALGFLNFTTKKAVEPIRKLLKSGMATAENDFKLAKSNLYISKIFVDEGPTLKRRRSRARGRIFPIMKRSSHVTLVLDEIERGKKVEKETKGKKVKESAFVEASTFAKATADRSAGKEKMVGESKEKKLERKPLTRAKIPKPQMRERMQKMFRRKAF